MSLYDCDHGLPLVALKEQRRDLIMSLVGHRGALSKALISEISALQVAIAAIEAVIDDLDVEAVGVYADYRPHLVI